MWKKDKNIKNEDHNQNTDPKSWSRSSFFLSFMFKANDISNLTHNILNFPMIFYILTHLQIQANCDNHVLDSLVVCYKQWCSISNRLFVCELFVTNGDSSISDLRIIIPGFRTVCLFVNCVLWIKKGYIYFPGNGYLS